MQDRPSIFLGSSEEARGVLERLVRLLVRRDIEVLPWYESFHPGKAAIEDLEEALDQVDFAAFLLRADDEMVSRGEKHATPRGNVIFELGYFMGRLGRARTVALVDVENPSKERVKLFSDLYGVTYVPYREGRLSDAAGRLRKIIEEHRTFPRVPKNVHLVDPDVDGRFAHHSISSAVSGAEPGDVVIVRPGVYRESLLLEKALEIVGTGTGGGQLPAIRPPTGQPAVRFSANGRGRLSSLSLEAGGGDDLAVVEVVDGVLAVDACHVTTTGTTEACVRIAGQARADLTGNNIVDGSGAGVVVCGRADAEIADNLIARHSHSGIEVRDSAAPRIVSNRVSEGHGGGILISGESSPLIDSNDISENQYSGLAVSEDGAPTVTGNRIHDGFSAGLWIGGNARGRFADNLIYGNRGTGIELNGGAPLITSNKIHDGVAGGILVTTDGGGWIEENIIMRNQRAGVTLLADAKIVSFIRNRVVDGWGEGVVDRTLGDWGHNEVDRNALGNWAPFES